MGCYHVLCVEVRTRSVLNQGCRLPSSNTYADVILLQLPPNPQGVRSPQPVHAVHSPYCRVLVRVPLWECVHGDQLSVKVYKVGINFLENSSN